MRRTEIMIFLVFINMALFGKVECGKTESDPCEWIDWFYFEDWQMLKPVYWRQTVFYWIMMAWSFDNFYQSKRVISFFAFLLFVCWYLDFVFRANLTWFRINDYPFSYSGFAAICFTIVIVIRKLYERA